MDPKDHPDLTDRTIFKSHSSDHLTIAEVLAGIAELS